MSPKPESTITPETDKTRAQLLSELQELRAQVAILREAEVKSKNLAEALRENAECLRLAQQAAHQSLAEKSRYLDAFFNHTITPLVLLDRDFNFIRVNEAYAKACQKDVDEFPGHNHFEFYPSDAREIFEDVIRTRQPFQVVARPFVFPDHPDWGVTYWNWTLTPLLDDRGEVEALVFALEDVTGPKRNENELEKHRDKLQELVREHTRDLEAANDHLLKEITEHKWAEESIRKSEERYSSLFEHMINGLAHCKMLYDEQDHPVDFVYLAVNDAFGRLTGLENVVGKRFTELFPGVRELHPEVFEIYSRVALTGQPEHFEIDFKPLSSWLSVAVYSTERGYFTAIFENITERKQAEEAVLIAKQQAELYLDLMGHDINNLHQIALGYLEMAKDMPPGEEQTVLLDKPVEVLQRSAQLIQNVRKLQRLHEGVFQTQDVDVSRVLSDVQREFGAVPHKRVTLNVNGHGPCFVRANELLHDVFANLVSNAIRHTGDRTNITIDLNVVKDNGGRYCLVAVEDDGLGIPDDFKAAIFNRTLKGTNKSRGMGLGLYLVKSLVDNYGGRIWVEDRIGEDHTKGARFVVILPATEQ